MRNADPGLVIVLLFVLGAAALGYVAGYDNAESRKSNLIVDAFRRAREAEHAACSCVVAVARYSGDVRPVMCARADQDDVIASAWPATPDEEP